MFVKLLKAAGAGALLASLLVDTHMGAKNQAHRLHRTRK